MSDCPGYGDITLTGNYLWALHRPDESYFSSDAFRRAVDYDLLISTPFVRSQASATPAASGRTSSPRTPGCVAVQ